MIVFHSFGGDWVFMSVFELGAGKNIAVAFLIMQNHIFVFPAGRKYQLKSLFFRK